MATKAEHITALKAQYSSLTKLTDGVRSTLSDSEYEATIDDWATTRAAEDVREALIESGGESTAYVEHRTNAFSGYGYKSLPDQLDQLYHDIDDGKFGTDAKTGAWYAAVKAVKDKYTKP
jgi:hypothetical protein